MENHSMKSYANKVKQGKRRVSALDRLRKQLQSGVKPLESARLYLTDQGSVVTQDLSENDIKRIKREIAILEKRV